MNNEQWFISLIEECRNIVVESGFASRWSLVEGYHLLGSRILQDEPNLTKGGTTLRATLQELAKYIGKRERSLYYAVEFVKKFPDLNALPEGKDINWYRIVNKYLTTESDKPAPLTNNDLRSIMHKIRELLKNEHLKAIQAEYEGKPLIPYEYKRLSEYIFYLQDLVAKLIDAGT